MLYPKTFWFPNIRSNQSLHWENKQASRILIGRKFRNLKNFSLQPYKYANFIQTKFRLHFSCNVGFYCSPLSSLMDLSLLHFLDFFTFQFPSFVLCSIQINFDSSWFFPMITFSFKFHRFPHLFNTLLCDFSIFHYR